MAVFALSFMKLKIWGPSTPQTSCRSLKRASSSKVRFTCKGAAESAEAESLHLPAMSSAGRPLHLWASFLFITIIIITTECH